MCIFSPDRNMWEADGGEAVTSLSACAVITRAWLHDIASMSYAGQASGSLVLQRRWRLRLLQIASCFIESRRIFQLEVVSTCAAHDNVWRGGSLGGWG